MFVEEFDEAQDGGFTIGVDSLYEHTTFPRSQDDDNPVVWFDLPTNSNMPPSEHAANCYRVRPVNKSPVWLHSWEVQKWDELQTRWSSGIRPAAGLPTFVAAVEWIVENANETPVHVAHPTAAEYATWASKGYYVYPAPMPTPASNDTVIITGATSHDEAAEIASAVAAEMVAEVTGVEQPAAPSAPALSIGDRFAVADDDGLYAVDEWTATGWTRVAEALEVTEIDRHLRPGAQWPSLPMIEVGACEIRPRGTIGDTFDVFTWDGTAWKQIAGDVSRRTAEGVVAARARDPETKGSSSGQSVRSVKKMILNRATSLKEILDNFAENPNNFKVMNDLVEEILQICKKPY